MLETGLEELLLKENQALFVFYTFKHLFPFVFKILKRKKDNLDGVKHYGIMKTIFKVKRLKPKFITGLLFYVKIASCIFRNYVETCKNKTCAINNTLIVNTNIALFIKLLPCKKFRRLERIQWCRMPEQHS